MAIEAPSEERCILKEFTMPLSLRGCESFALSCPSRPEPEQKPEPEAGSQEPEAGSLNLLLPSRGSGVLERHDEHVAIGGLGGIDRLDRRDAVRDPLVVDDSGVERRGESELS